MGADSNLYFKSQYKLSMQQDPQSQSILIEASLLRWISLIKGEQVSTFEDLTCGEFYLELLSDVKGFKLTKNIAHESQKDNSGLNDSHSSLNHSLAHCEKVTLATRISNMKVIGDSIVRYYQTVLMKDVSCMKINFVELCIENSSAESIKLFSLVIGLFSMMQQTEKATNKTYIKMMKAIGELPEDDQYIVNALLENSAMIGEEIVEKSGPRSDSPLRKTIIAKLENYEDKLDALERDNMQLKEQLEGQLQKAEYLEAEVKDLKKEKAKVVQKTEVLEILNSNLENQNSGLMIENQSLKQKNASLKEEKQHLSRQQQALFQQLRAQEEQNGLLLAKIGEIKKANEDLQSFVTEQKKLTQHEQEKVSLLKIQLQKLEGKHKELLLELGQTQNKLDAVLTSGANEQGQRASQSKEQILCSNTSQFSSVKYRVADNLQLFGSQLSKVEMVNSICNLNSLNRQLGSNSNSGPNDTLSKKNGNSDSSGKNVIPNVSRFMVNQIGVNAQNGGFRDVSQFSERKQLNFSGLGDLRTGEEQLVRSMIIEEQQLKRENQDRKDSHQINNIHSNQHSIQKSKNDSSDSHILSMISRLESRNRDQHEILITVLEDLYCQNQFLKEELSKFSKERADRQQRHQIFRKKAQKACFIEKEQIKDFSKAYSLGSENKENHNIINL